MKTATGSASARPVATIPPEPLLADGFNEARSEATEAIAAKGRERGFVTSEDVLGGLPEIQLTPEQIEEFLAHVEQVLRAEGIDVIDVPGDDNLVGAETDGARRRRREELLKTPAFDPVRMYLKEIGRVPLLTAAQEVDLAMRIEAGELAGDLLASVADSGRMDGKRFLGVVDAVIRIRDHQLDPEKRLRFEGIGRETLRRSHRPRGRGKAVDLLRRVKRDAAVAKHKLIEANLRLVVSISLCFATAASRFTRRSKSTA